HLPGEVCQPLWNGEPLEGKTILVRAEQGFGDTLQFIRYAKRLKDMGATVLVEENGRMAPLVSGCPGVDRVVASGANLPPLDVQVPLLSLPRIFQTTLATIPAGVPYLFAEERLVEKWRERLASATGFRIGINWHG